MSLEQGLKAEEFAYQYLLQQGLCLVTRNFHSRFGEIDLIFMQDSLLIFVEVRQRKSAAFGGALASVTYKKQQKLLRTAEFFLQKQPQFKRNNCRFDVIAIDGVPFKLHWVKNAFGQ